MHNFLWFISKWADSFPEKPAIIAGSDVISYAELQQQMWNRGHLPIPLLGDSWDGDFCLYTTGTMGKAKGVVISQRAVIANSENLIAGQGFSRDLVFVIAGDMSHLGCWSKIFPTLLQGGTLLILKYGMRDMDAFFRAFDLPLGQYGLVETTKFATFLVPSNIRILLQFASDRVGSLADKLEFLETGAAPMHRSDMLKLCELLPKTRLYNTYASTETGVVSTYNYNEFRTSSLWSGEQSSDVSPERKRESCLAGCLGKPLPHSGVFITETGHIACTGDTLMSGYRGDVALTRSVLHDNAVFTNDRGYLDDDGRLHLLCRDDDIINVGGYKVNPSEVEGVALELPEISDCICIARGHPILGLAPALLVVMRGDALLDRRYVSQYIAKKLDSFKVPLSYTCVDFIERTFNGKLNRKYYRDSKYERINELTN